MRYDPRTPVGDLVAARSDRYKIFADLGIDFCCGGHRSLEEASREAGRAVDDVIEALAADDAATGGRPDSEPDWRAATLAELTAHLEGTHHDYMKRALPRLAGMMEKVVAAHGKNHPRLAEVAAIFGDLRDELDGHLQKEERVLFPLIRRMEAERTADGVHCGSVLAPIGVMEQEHDQAGAALRRLRALTDDYTPPADACPTYRALLEGLAEMESDLHLHIHKENNILHPRVAALEAALRAPKTSAGKGAD